MSPNPEACEDELAFREGQLIKVIGEKDADGFYFGECNGLQGYVPCNMVSEVQVDDDRFMQEKTHFKENWKKTKTNQLTNKENWSDAYGKTPVRKMIALYDYDPQELSPNVDAEVELKFQTGDIIYVYGEMDDDGFFLAELRGHRGLVPSNFLTEATSTDSHDKNKINISGASGPPPPPRDLGSRDTTGRDIVHKGIANIPSMEAKPIVSTFAVPKLQQRIEEQKVTSHINLDKIPGLDDDFDDIPVVQQSVKPNVHVPTVSINKTHAPSAKTQSAGQEAETGLLGGLTQGLTGLAGGGVSGITGKLGDLAGSATSAGGGLLSSGKGLFKKFGF